MSPNRFIEAISPPFPCFVTLKHTCHHTASLMASHLFMLASHHVWVVVIPLGALNMHGVCAVTALDPDLALTSLRAFAELVEPSPGECATPPNRSQSSALQAPHDPYIERIAELPTPTYGQGTRSPADASPTAQVVQSRSRAHSGDESVGRSARGRVRKGAAAAPAAANSASDCREAPPLLLLAPAGSDRRLRPQLPLRGSLPRGVATSTGALLESD